MAYGMVGIWPVCAPQEDCLFCIIFVTFVLDFCGIFKLLKLCLFGGEYGLRGIIHRQPDPYLLEASLCEIPCAKSMGISR